MRTPLARFGLLCEAIVLGILLFVLFLVGWMFDGINAVMRWMFGSNND